MRFVLLSGKNKEYRSKLLEFIPWRLLLARFYEDIYKPADLLLKNVTMRFLNELDTKTKIDELQLKELTKCLEVVSMISAMDAQLNVVGWIAGFSFFFLT